MVDQKIATTPVSQLSYRLKQQPVGMRMVPRVYPEWVIDGIPLVDLLAQINQFEAESLEASDMMPPMIWFHGDEATARLLLELPTDLRSGRHSLLVCSLCGDPCCGVVSAKIERSKDVIVWRDFGSENDHPAVGWCDPTSFANLGPYVFRLESYERTIREMQRVGFAEFMKCRDIEDR